MRSSGVQGCLGNASSQNKNGLRKGIEEGINWGQAPDSLRCIAKSVVEVVCVILGFAVLAYGATVVKEAGCSL